MMDDHKMEELYRMVKENNAMLKSARRSAFIGGIVKAVWWIFILIVLPYLTWLYLQPYLETILMQYQGMQDQTGALSTQAADIQKQLSDLGGISGFQELLSKFGFGKSQ